MITFCGKFLHFLLANYAGIVESIQARRIQIKLNIADQRSEGKEEKNVKKNTTAGKLLLRALFLPPSTVHPATPYSPAFHAPFVFAIIFGFSPFYPGFSHLCLDCMVFHLVCKAT